MGDELRQSQELFMLPGTVYELRGTRLVPIEWPGLNLIAKGLESNPNKT